MSRSIRPRLPYALFFAAVLASALLASGAQAAPPASPEAQQKFDDYMNQFESYFAAHPEFLEEGENEAGEVGHGWEPFNRMKWFWEQRRTETGQLPAAGAYQRAWETRKEREAQSPFRSNTWNNLGPTNFTGRILALDFDPNDVSTMYVGAASGGVWKTTDGGATWVPLTDDMPVMSVGGLAVSKTNPNIIVIGTGEGTHNIDVVNGIGIWRSLDGGDTWEATDLTYDITDGGCFHFVECGPNGTFLAGARDGLYRSTDDGATWELNRVGGEYYDAKWKPGSADTVYTVKGNGTQNYVRISVDDGAHWAKAGVGQPTSPMIGKSKLAVSADDPNTVYAVFAELGTANDIVGVYRSQDNGQNWTVRYTPSGPSQPIGGQLWYNLILVADPNDVDRLIMGGQSLRRSTNGGTSWLPIGTGVHVDYHCVSYEPGSNSNVWVGNDGGVYRSANDGTNWTDMNNGLITYQFYDICVNNGPTAYYVMGGTQDNGTDKWSGTTTWANGLGGDGMVCNVATSNGTTVYGEQYDGNHYRSTTSGTGFQPVNLGLTGSGAWVTPVGMGSDDDLRVYTATTSGIFKLNLVPPDTLKWFKIGLHNTNSISVSPLDGDLVWTSKGSNGPIFTTNNGASWDTCAAFGFATTGATRVLAHPTDVNTVLVAFGGYSAVTARVAYSTDLGTNWIDATGNLPGEPVNAIAVDPTNPDDWYIGTDTGVWFSNDHGATWYPYELGLPNVVIADLEIQDAQRKLVAGTYGRGAWEIDIPADINTAVYSSPDATAPRHVALDVPYPNPASDRTLLRYAAHYEGLVTLDVYDVTGRLVDHVTSLPRGDGVVRTTPWFPGKNVATGVYFAVLKAGDEKISQKIVLAR